MKARNHHKESYFYLAIILFCVLYLFASFYFNVDVLSKRITTVTALISAVAFWMQFKRTERLNESNFIMNLNNQFIGNKDMTFIEHNLELYYNQYEILAQNLAGRERITHKMASRISLRISQARDSEDCQKLINYLVYLESLAALVDRGVIHLDVIDDLFSYRFFIAVNNPVVQDNEIYPYSDFYRGVFRLSKRWSDDHRKRGIPIPMDEFCLSEEGKKKWENNKYKSFLEISHMRSSDNKTDVARVLYQTDPYIYPEAFGPEPDKAAKAFGSLIGQEGTLLDDKNIVVARYNGQIAGICLLSDGTCKWNTKEMIRRIGNLLPSVESFAYASEHYFSKLNQRTDTIEIVACCVDNGFRRKHIASAMLTEILQEYQNSRIELSVLSENEDAIRLYEKLGFVKVGVSFEGFASPGQKKPLCWKMFFSPSESDANI